MGGMRLLITNNYKFYKMNTSRIMRFLFCAVAIFLCGSMSVYADVAECEWQGYKNGVIVSTAKGSGNLSSAINETTATTYDSVAIKLLKNIHLTNFIQIISTKKISINNPNNDTITVDHSFLYYYRQTSLKLYLNDLIVRGNISSVGSNGALIYNRGSGDLCVKGGSYISNSTDFANTIVTVFRADQASKLFMERVEIVNSPSSKNKASYAMQISNTSGSVQHCSMGVYTDLTAVDAPDTESCGVSVDGSSNVSFDYNNIVVNSKKAKGIFINGSSAQVLSNANIIILPYADVDTNPTHPSLFSLWVKSDVGTSKLTVHGGVYSANVSGTGNHFVLESGYYSIEPKLDLYDTHKLELSEIWQGDNKYYELKYKTPSEIPAGTSLYTARIYCGDSKHFDYSDYLATGVAPTFLSETDNVLFGLYPNSNAIAYIELPVDTTGMNGAFDYTREDFPKHVAVKYYNKPGYYARQISLKDEAFYSPVEITLPSAENLTYRRQFKARTTNGDGVVDTVSLGTVCLPFAIDGMTVAGNKCELLDVKGYADKQEATPANPEEQLQRLLFTPREDILPANTPSFINVGNNTDFFKSFRSDTCEVWDVTFVSKENVLHPFSATKKSYNVGESNKMWLCGTDSIYVQGETDPCKYWAMNQNGTTLGWIAPGQTMKPMRAYIMFSEVPESFLSSTSNARMLCNVLVDEKDVKGAATNINIFDDEVIAESAIVDVYSANGQLLRKSVEMRDAFNGLNSGIYVVGGQKYILR